MTNAVDRSPRQTRHLSFVAEFTNNVQHVSGRDNVVADTLSRTPTIATVLSLAADQATSDEIHAYRTAITGLKLEDVLFQDYTVLCDISTGYIRPIISREWRRCIFDIIHGLSHAGNHPTLRAILRRFVWHKMKTDVRNWRRTCHPCQSSIVQRHVHAPLQPRTLPDQCFGSLHVDIVGPLSESMMYLFTIVDRNTRWAEAIPMAGCSTETCIKGFLRHWIARFGDSQHTIVIGLSDPNIQHTIDTGLPGPNNQHIIVICLSVPNSQHTINIGLTGLNSQYTIGTCLALISDTP